MTTRRGSKVAHIDGSVRDLRLQLCVFRQMPAFCAVDCRQSWLKGLEIGAGSVVETGASLAYGALGGAAYGFHATLHAITSLLVTLTR